MDSFPIVSFLGISIRAFLLAGIPVRLGRTGIDPRRSWRTARPPPKRSTFITSLAKERADPRRLLTLDRGHWAIENRLHYVRHVPFDEDRSQVRTGLSSVPGVPGV